MQLERCNPSKGSIQSPRCSHEQVGALNQKIGCQQHVGCPRGQCGARTTLRPHLHVVASGAILLVHSLDCPPVIRILIQQGDLLLPFCLGSAQHPCRLRSTILTLRAVRRPVHCSMKRAVCSQDRAQSSSNKFRSCRAVEAAQTTVLLGCLKLVESFENKSLSLAPC